MFFRWGLYVDDAFWSRSINNSNSKKKIGNNTYMATGPGANYRVQFWSSRKVLQVYGQVDHSMLLLYQVSFHMHI